MKYLKFIILFFTAESFLFQSLRIDKIEPPNWWAGHTYSNIQLMIYGSNLDSVNVISSNANFSVEEIILTENTDYVFVNVSIAESASPGEYLLKFSNSYGDQEILYKLEEREKTDNRHRGFSNDDVIYLIFPDRFSNGDVSNDHLNNENDEFDFRSLNGRHGGDIKGIIDKLDYIKDLGITAIWSTPLVENNMYMSYHGYAATDFYKIDPRHGTNELYKELVDSAHQKGMKVIYDHVSNHIGINHRWVKSLPTNTWLNGIPGDHLPADHDKIPYVDPYRSDLSLRNVNEGWFVDYMPDLNQRDSLLAKYIVQNTIWWIEFSGIDGIREDTYPYANQKFMADWAREILKHYPDFNIVGEVWKGDPAIIAAFQTNSYFPKEFDSFLPVVTDFAFRDIVFDFLAGKANINAFYELLGKDFVYSDPNNLLVFFDNHDIDRGMYAAKWDLHKFKVALTLTLTTRGIPKIFYGTEIGMDGGGHHGRIRAPFPGGFPDDKNNAFVREGRNSQQNEIFDFLRKLLHLRKDYSALRSGRLTQFQPKDNLYIYKKTNDLNQILIIINDSDFNKVVNLNEYFYKDESIYVLKSLLTGDELVMDGNNFIESDKKSISIYLIQ